ncbi:MAG: hypothetical protein QM488_19495 [Rhizobiaceae bacterium]
MDETTFGEDRINELDELSELRLNLEQENHGFELMCSLKFGNMQYEYNERCYQIGVTRAYLRLALEGCDTKLDGIYGENLLSSVTEENSTEHQTEVVRSGMLAAGIDANLVVNGSGSAAVSAKASRRETVSQTQTSVRSPVVAAPNNSWKIEYPTGGEKKKAIEGTLISNERLCPIVRKKGGNRMGIIGELHVSKSAFKITAEGGNRIGKTASEWRNKDPIIAQILKRAIQREAAMQAPSSNSSTVTICKTHIFEN